MLNSKKSQAILQWFNSLTTKGDVNSLVQFSDGSHFFDIVVSLQKIIRNAKNYSTSATVSEGIAGNEDEVSVEQGAEEEKTETSVSESENDGPFVNKEADIETKYDVIRKFIDDFYHIESSSLINYDECQNEKELELAKVAVFLLTAMVQTLLCVQNETVFNAALLEPEIQVNIHECMSYIFDNKDLEENQFKKSEFHRILSRPASYKATPVRRRPSRGTSDPSDFSDDKIFSKKRRERTSAVMYEDPQDSPLRNLLESPKVKYKTAMFRKDSELTKLRNAFLNEENKVMDLIAEKRTLNEELEKRNKEIEFYKKELESQREAFCQKEEQERVKSAELKDKDAEEKRLKKHIEELEEEIKQLSQNIETLHLKVEDLETKQEQDKTVPLTKENGDLRDRIGTLEFDSGRKDEEINALNEKIINLENDLNKYQQMCQEFSASNKKEELGSPNVPETLSAIIYTDELISQETLEQKEQVLKQQYEELQEDRIKQLSKLKARNAALEKNIQNLTVELTIVKEKYDKVEKLAKKKEADAKKLLMVVATIPGGLGKLRESKSGQKKLGESRSLSNKDQKLDKQSKNEIPKKCEECETAKKRVKDLTKELEEFKQCLIRFKLSNNGLTKSEKVAKLEIVELKKKIEELEQELWLQKSSLSQNTADRDFAIAHYMANSKQEFSKKLKDRELKGREQRNRSQTVIKNPQYADDDQSTSNSMLASGSMHNRFFQTADEEDFLSESSLAEIYNLNILDDANGENRLDELRRRNTLCPPHLQSSYPLEIQDMTPSEKKYYIPVDASFNPDSSYQGHRVPQKKSRNLDGYNEDSDDSCSFPIKKRKVGETKIRSVYVSKNSHQPSTSVSKAKSSTPLKQVTSFVRRQTTFKTPVSIHQLMGMRRKKKMP